MQPTELRGKTMDELRRELAGIEFRQRYGTIKDVPTDPFTYQHVVDELLSFDTLRKRADTWSQRDDEITAFVHGFEHRVLPTITPDQVERVRDASSHALGKLDKQRDTHRFIDFANPKWAITYLFHEIMERDGRVPSWDRFFDLMTTTYAPRWWRIVRRAAQRRRVGTAHADRAMRWRLATGWLGNLRTVYALSVLRHRHGIPLRYQLFAHAELRIDGWYGHKAFRSMMPSRFEDHKKSPQAIFAGTDFEIRDVVTQRQGEGVAWLPSLDALERAAAWFNESDEQPEQTSAPTQVSLFEVAS